MGDLLFEVLLLLPLAFLLSSFRKAGGSAVAVAVAVAVVVAFLLSSRRDLLLPLAFLGFS